MLFPWSSQTEARFRRTLEKDSAKSYRSILLIAFPFFTAFAFLDFIVQPPELRLLTFKIRFLTLLAFLPLYFSTKKPDPASAIPSLLIFACTGSITAIAYISNGFKSPYFFGMSLLIFLMPQLFTWSPLKIGLHAFGVSTAYVLTILARDHFIIVDHTWVVEVCAYLAASSIIAVWGSWVSDSLRRKSFVQFLEAEEARDRIEKTVKILQAELQQKSDDPVTLSKELATRKTELQEEVWSEQESKAKIASVLNTRDEFISIASHELKTPITVMKLQSWLLKKYLSQMDITKTHPGILAFVERNDAQIKRLMRLVDDMLDLSRIRTGTFRLEPEKVELCALVRELVERYQPQFYSAGIEVKVSTCDEVAGTWDRMRLEQVISNLFNNAIKYAPKAPLEVRVSRPNADEVLIEFHDQGPGISKTHQSKIFERFERAGADTSVSGLGLGLYISRQIVRGHGGDMEIDEAQEKGACFKVKLPTQFPAEQSA